MGAYGGPDIVTDGLVLCLDAGDKNSYPGSGATWYDLSVEGNNITIPGSPSTPTYNSAGYFSFDGSGERDGNPLGDYIGGGFGGAGGLCSSNQYLASGASYCWWSRITTAQSNGQCILYGSSTMDHIEFKNEGTASPYFRTEAAKQNGYKIGNQATIPGGSLVGRWVYFVIVIDNSASPRTAYWYSNGVEFDEKDITTGTYPSDEYFYLNYIGRSTGTSAYLYSQSFYGDLGNFQFYGRALSSTEVKQNFETHRARFGV
jgi:hypothetical protein